MYFLKKLSWIILVLGAPLSCAFNVFAVEQNHLSQQAFLALAQANQDGIKSSPAERLQKKTLWLNQSIQAQINQILHHDYPKLRLTYFQKNAANIFQTVWFLDEIGKERPISFGISVINDRVDLVRVLTFRESRGGEIQMQAFSDQFNQIGLNAKTRLDKSIDGITGATMSVSAMKKITRVALSLHRLVLKMENQR